MIFKIALLLMSVVFFIANGELAYQRGDFTEVGGWTCAMIWLIESIRLSIKNVRLERQLIP